MSHQVLWVTNTLLSDRPVLQRLAAVSSPELDSGKEKHATKRLFRWLADVAPVRARIRRMFGLGGTLDDTG